MDRWTVRVPLSVAGFALLAGCPQLLEDGFETSSRAGTPEGGQGTCTEERCVVTQGDASIAPPVVPLRDAGEPDPPPSTPDADTSVASPDAGGSVDSAPDATTAPPSCRTLVLSDTTHSSSDNCVGIYGWNDSVSDTGSSVATTYQDGKVCFAGRIGTSGWGAAYNFTFANQNDWNAASYGVTGLEFTASGPQPPAEMKVFFTDSQGDTCHSIAPQGAVGVPFTSAHPNCSTNASERTPILSTLSYMALTWRPAASAYDFDFCVRIRALP
jgi:hypothetical protein